MPLSSRKEGAMPDDPSPPPQGDPEPTPAPAPKPEPTDLGEAGKAALAAERAARKAAEKKAATVQAELEEARKASMSEQERAIADAKKQTRAEVLAEVGTARAADAIRFSVGDRLPEDELESLLEDLNLARFLAEDGTVNKAKVTEYVGRIAPAKTNGVPDLGQGPRGGKSVPVDDSPRGLITAGLAANEATRKH